MNQLATEERTKILGCLIEGCSMRATSRLTGAAKKTVDRLFVRLPESLAKPRGSGADLDSQDGENGAPYCVRTARTPSPLPTREATDTVKSEEELIESAKGVRSVREDHRAIPHLLADGTLVIPFGSPERFHWWKKGGMTPTETRRYLAVEGQFVIPT